MAIGTALKPTDIGEPYERDGESKESIERPVEVGEDCGDLDETAIVDPPSASADSIGMTRGRPGPPKIVVGVPMNVAGLIATNGASGDNMGDANGDDLGENSFALARRVDFRRGLVGVHTGADVGVGCGVGGRGVMGGEEGASGSNGSVLETSSDGADTGVDIVRKMERPATREQRDLKLRTSRSRRRYGREH